MSNASILPIEHQHASPQFCQRLVDLNLPTDTWSIWARDVDAEEEHYTLWSSRYLNETALRNGGYEILPAYSVAELMELIGVPLSLAPYTDTETGEDQWGVHHSRRLTGSFQVILADALADMLIRFYTEVVS